MQQAKSLPSWHVGLVQGAPAATLHTWSEQYALNIPADGAVATLFVRHYRRLTSYQFSGETHTVEAPIAQVTDSPAYVSDLAKGDALLIALLLRAKVSYHLMSTYANLTDKI